MPKLGSRPSGSLSSGCLVCCRFFVRSGKAVFRPVACNQVPGARGREHHAGSRRASRLGSPRRDRAERRSCQPLAGRRSAHCVGHHREFHLRPGEAQAFSNRAKTRFAPLRHARDRSARSRRASCNIAPIRLALCRRAPVKSAPRSKARSILIPRRSSPEKSLPAQVDR
jgi:hypothetical protein